MEKYDLFNSVKHALKPSTIIGKILAFIIYTICLSLDMAGKYMDMVGRGQINFLYALIEIWKIGTKRALVTIYPFLLEVFKLPFSLDFSFFSKHIGTSIISLFFLLLLFGAFYHPIDLIINALDGRTGKSTSIIFRFVVTLIVLLITSSIYFYTSGDIGLFSNSINSSVTNEIVNQTINLTNSTNNIVVIDLI